MSTEPRNGDWIQTVGGRKFWPLDPRREDVCVHDIAHSLANQCRFVGHSKTFYSVAQHSVLASQIVPRQSAMAGLLHDAAEAYMGDVARPFKRFLHAKITDEDGDEVFVRLKDREHKLLDVILEALGCPGRALLDIWEPIEKADELLLVTEARDFMSPLADGWRHRPENGFAILPDPISPWTPGRASYEFLKRFGELGGKF